MAQTQRPGHPPHLHVRVLIFLAHNAWERIFLLGLAILQLIEGRLPLLDKTWGRATSVALQLILGFLLIGLTGSIQSQYYLVLLLPIVSTASYLNVAGTLLSSSAGVGTWETNLAAPRHRSDYRVLLKFGMILVSQLLPEATSACGTESFIKTLCTARRC